MMTLRKYLSGLLFLFLGAIPLILAVQFIIGQQVAEHKAIEQLKNGNCKTYTFPRKQVQWIEPGKELLVNGKLFDVKSYQESKEYITLAGFFDEEEDKLWEKYKRIVNKNNGTTGHDFLFLKIFFTPCISPAVDHLQPNISLLTVINYYPFTEQGIEQSGSIITPPPQRPAV